MLFSPLNKRVRLCESLLGVGMQKSVVTISLLLASVSFPALAAETIAYKYDAKGRLIEVKRTGTVNNNVTTAYTHDKANNRKTVVVTGGLSPAFSSRFE